MAGSDIELRFRPACGLAGPPARSCLSELAHAHNAARQAEKIHAALSAPNAIAQHEFRLNVSIGISIFPDDGQDAETLVECADAAMYHAKLNGRNADRFFKPEMNVRTAGRRTLDARPRPPFASTQITTSSTR